MRKHVFALGALAIAGAGLIGSAPAAAQTNGFVLQCLSAKAAGQGCITRGVVGLPTNMFRDPASIAWFDEATLELNAAAFMPSLTFQNSANPNTADGALHSYPLGSVGYIAKKPFERFSWAIGFEPIGGFGSDFKLDNPVLGSDQDYESFFAAAKAGPVVAWEPVGGLSLGAAVNVVYSQIHKFRMPFAMPPQAAAGIGALGQMDPHYATLFGEFTELVAYGDSRDFSGWGWGASLGLGYRTPSFAVSASWSPRTDLSLNGGTATIDMNRQFGIVFDALVRERIQNHGESQQIAQQTVGQMLGAAGLDLSLGASASFKAATELAIPETAGLGLSVKPINNLSIALEAVWMRWSDAENTMPFILTEGDNPNVNMLVNADPSNADFTFPFPLHWQDTWTGKVGLEYQVDQTTALRAGYLYGDNPVPDNTVFIAFPAIATHAITTGAGFNLGKVPLQVSIVHAIQTRFNGCNKGHMISSEYINSSTTMRQTTFTFGVVWPF